MMPHPSSAPASSRAKGLVPCYWFQYLVNIVAQSLVERVHMQTFAWTAECTMHI